MTETVARWYGWRIALSETPGVDRKYDRDSSGYKRDVSILRRKGTESVWEIVGWIMMEVFPFGKGGTCPAEVRAGHVWNLRGVRCAYRSR